MRHASSISPHAQRMGRRPVTAVLLSLTIVSAAPVAAVPPPGDADAAVIATWNEIAVNTVTNNGAAASPTSFNYFAFVHLAMYNAVVGITGEYELYHWDKHAPTGASPEAAAADGGRIECMLVPVIELVLTGDANDRVVHGEMDEREVVERRGAGRRAVKSHRVDRNLVPGCDEPPRRRRPAVRTLSVFFFALVRLSNTAVSAPRERGEKWTMRGARVTSVWARGHLGVPASTMYGGCGEPSFNGGHEKPQAARRRGTVARHLSVRASLAGVSENICYTDAYARTDRSLRRGGRRRANAVLLERTVFYPGGGGQPADTGVLIGDSGGSWRVIGAKKRDDDIWHTIEAGSELPAVDTKVIAELDWDRRHALMRTHSALHVLCGVVGATTRQPSPAATWSRSRGAWTSSSRRCRAISSARSSGG